ncbi:MAG: response regulator [Lachnospiraceae bacterium]|nr:response regulator [Lachnospiraceae bacterium]
MIKVLIVDDERIIRLGIRSVVPWDSFGVKEVFEAASGKAAMKIIEKEHPDLVITDIQMAEMTGLELIAKIRQWKEDTRIIVLTGYDEFDYARECLRMQVQDFLLKPVDEENLIQIIKNEIQYISDVKERAEKQSHLWRIAGTKEQTNLEKFMRKLIYQKDIGETICFLAEHYHYNMDSKFRMILLLPSFDLGLKREEESDFLTRLTIKNLIIGYLDANDYGITFEDAESRLLICLFEGNNSDESEKHLKTILQLAKDECGVLLSFAQGSIVRGFKEAHISYNDAIHYLLKNTDKLANLIAYKYGEGQLDLFREVYGEFIRKLNDNTGDTENALRIFEAFCAAADAYNITDQYVRKCCFEMASSIYFCFVVESGESTNKKLDVLLSGLMNTSRAENFSITKTFMEELLETNDGDNEIVSHVKRYIKDNLSEDISVAGIATHFYFSTNYFSRLFKRVTGERCNEYIARSRMKKAEYLLSATNMKVGQVALEVGYRDTNYFSLSFKKHLGLSPGQYRREKRETILFD